jgi:uncharacterized protein YpmS
MPALHAVHDGDPRKELMKKVGKLDMELFGNAILVAIYVRPKTAQFGTLKLHLTDSTVKEDENQGKIGLVIGLGPMAYVDDEVTQFHDQKVEVGDWVVFRPSEGWALTLTRNQVPCRLLTEANIRMRVPRPDSVW